MVQHPDGKFRFAIAPNILNSDTAGYDFFDSEMNGSPTVTRTADNPKKLGFEPDEKSTGAGAGWLFYAHLFDSKYIDQHVYRLFFRNGTIPSYNSSTVQIIFPLSRHVITEMEDYAIKRKLRNPRSDP